MEKYLDRSVGSLLVPEVLDKLEIIIVNDGSKDRTLEIANGYKAKYPQSVIVIDKPNGHYGSTVNAALKIATGKYFRILDADDWFNSEALGKFVAKLEELDVDCVCTQYTQCEEDKSILRTVSDVEFDKVYNLAEFRAPYSTYYMHSLTHRREFLVSIKYEQIQGICYTDTEYVYIPLIQAKTICYLELNLYQYFRGRDDQSMSPKSLAKNYSHFLIILERMIKLDESTDWSLSNASASSIFYYYYLLLLTLLLAPSLIHNSLSIADKQRIRAVLDYVKSRDIDAFTKIMNQRSCKIKIFKLWYNKSVFTPICLWLIRQRESLRKSNS
jgi:glycosyltransferase involved in cell wall biosynthesis